MYIRGYFPDFFVQKTSIDKRYGLYIRYKNKKVIIKKIKQWKQINDNKPQKK